MDPVVRAVVSRYKEALTKSLNLEWVEKMRADFLTLMKNLPRLHDYDTAARLRAAFAIYKENYKKFIFDELLKSDDAPFSLSKARGILWDFYLELSLPMRAPNNELTEADQFQRFLREKDAWEKRVKARAQRAWKALRESLELQDQKRIDTEVPDEQRVVLEGFQAVLLGYSNEDWKLHTMEILRESLRVYRRRAAAVCPWMLKNQLPIVVDFEHCRLDQGGFYERDRITFCMLTLSGEGVARGVHVLAHEMGHHLYKRLPSAAAEFWETAINQDYGPLDLLDVLNVWPESIKWYTDFVDMMAAKDPVLALQVDVLGMGAKWGDGYEKREDFQRAYNSGTLSMKVPKHPITAYAGKNPEEAFCDALALLVTHGPQAVMDEVKHWLSIVIPGTVKTASSVWVPLEPNKHYRVVCTSCGTVITQCRCRGPKTVIRALCKQCGGLG